MTPESELGPIPGDAQREGPPILLVDDNPTNLQVLYQTLSGRGYRLLIARDGPMALSVAEKMRPALILLDIMMPGMDGYEVCRQLKQNAETSHMTVVFLSALDDTADKVRGLELGAVDYITKPFHDDEVIARVNAHFRLHCLERELARRNRSLQAANARILYAVGEGICGIDLEGRISFVNPAASKITGWDEDELIDCSIDLLHAGKGTNLSIPNEAHSKIRDTLTSGRTHRVEDTLFTHRNGHRFPAAYTSTPLFENEKLEGAVVAFRDITQRKRDEEALRQALTELRALKERLQAENEYLQAEIKTERNFGEITGESSALQTTLAQLERVAPTDTTVLILGESGTGKEAIARALHKLSRRSERPLIKVNCGAIPAGLIESELFGHEKGAFTGAIKSRIGHFELADGGTVFLDEIGELSTEAQVKILRVLQEHEFERVGSGKTIRVDVRLIAATHRDLESMVREGTFRLDLYYRLNIFPLRVPSLRERMSDIPLLVQTFLRNLSKRLDKPLHGISANGMRQLMAYHWPGNIRELQNVIERACILAQGPEIEIDHALGPITPTSMPTPPTQQVAAHGSRTLAENEHEHIVRTLEQVGWTVDGAKGAAAILGVPSSTLRSRMKKLRISRPR